VILAFFLAFWSGRLMGHSQKQRGQQNLRPLSDGKRVKRAVENIFINKQDGTIVLTVLVHYFTMDP